MIDPKSKKKSEICFPKICNIEGKVDQNSFQHIPKTQILMGHNFDSLSIDAKIMVSKNCPITGEHIGVIFVTQ